MQIDELIDTRDQEACYRAEHFPSVHERRRQDKFWRRVSVPDPIVPGFDHVAEKEFQAGVPFVKEPETYVTLTPAMRADA